MKSTIRFKEVYTVLLPRQNRCFKITKLNMQTKLQYTFDGKSSMFWCSYPNFGINQSEPLNSKMTGTIPANCILTGGWHVGQFAGHPSPLRDKTRNLLWKTSPKFRIFWQFSFLSLVKWKTMSLGLHIC